MGNTEQNPRYNASHCYDPTAYEAITRVDRENKEREILAKKVIKTIQNVAHLAGFDIVGNITLRDNKTGKIRG